MEREEGDDGENSEEVSVWSILGEDGFEEDDYDDEDDLLFMDESGEL
jgi:hypothetical protein